jgi:hypothetical protein
MGTDSRANLVKAFSGKVWHHDISRIIVERGRQFALTDQQRSRRYPSRLLRYHVPFHWIAREAVRRGRPLRVCEIGIGSGLMHRFLVYGLEIRGVEYSDVVEHWVGVDVKLLRDALAELPYDRLIEADLEKDLDKIPTACDVCILLHVIEHLYQPEAAIRRLFSRFEEGTLIIAGFPCHPDFAVRFREPYLRKYTNSNGHVSAMSNARFTRAARSSDCEIEELRGAYFLRASGLFLEDYLWWQKFNLAWGGLFPAWPGESFTAARKQSAPGATGARRAA